MQKNQYMMVPGDDIQAYCDNVCSLPILSSDEEMELAKKYYEEKHLPSAQKLVLHHLRFVISVAGQYSGYNLPYEDIIQEGTVGLMKAVKGFNPNKGFRFSTYAQRWIRSEIYEYVISNVRSYKIATTKNQRKLFFNLKSYLADVPELTTELVDKIVEELEVRESDVYEMYNRLHTFDAPLDPLGGIDDGERGSLIETMVSDSKTPEEIIVDFSETNDNIRSINSAMKSLPDRTKEIVERRYLSEKRPTLKVLADEYGVSIERIRQIEANGLKQMKEAMTA